MEWSLDLLSPRQRLGFALLSVFSGGFDLRAAEAVLLVEGFDRAEAADLMVELVDRSMVEPDAIGHGRRYRLLETLRHYGSGLLDKHGGDAARHAHAEHYADLAVALVGLVWGPEQGIALEQYELEVANVRTAFQWSLAADDIELAGRIAEAGWEFGAILARLRGGGVGGGGVRTGPGAPAAGRRHAARDRRLRIVPPR